jgi:hypothetical protein
MATIVISIDIPEGGFDTDEDVIEFRDRTGETVCSLIRLIGFDKAVSAEVEYAD